MDISNLETLSVRDNDREAIGSFARQVMHVLKDELRSITVYGSAVKDNYFPGSSDINVLLLVDDFTPGVMKKAAPVVKGYSGRSRISTYVADVNDIQDSSDVFPIMYLDMKNYHRVLWGEDILNGLEIDPGNIRHDLERQVRNVSLRIRQMYMLSNYTAAELRNILVSNFSGFSHYLAALLHLAGVEPPMKKEEIIRETARVFRLDLSVLERIMELKRGGNNPLKAEMQGMFDEYFLLVERIVEIVDKLEVV